MMGSSQFAFQQRSTLGIPLARDASDCGRALDRDRDGYVSVRVGLRGRRERARSRPPRQRARRERHPDVLVSEDDGIGRPRDPRFANVASRPSRRVRLRGRRRAG